MDDRPLEPDSYGDEFGTPNERGSRVERWGERHPRERSLSPERFPSYPVSGSGSGQRGQEAPARRFSPLYVDAENLAVLWPFGSLLSNRSRYALETLLKLTGAWEIRSEPGNRSRTDVVAEALHPLFGQRLPQMQLGPGPLRLDSGLGTILLVLFLLDQRLLAKK